LNDISYQIYYSIEYISAHVILIGSKRKHNVEKVIEIKLFLPLTRRKVCNFEAELQTTHFPDFPSWITMFPYHSKLSNIDHKSKFA
jgi:hypothetical protein